ncbi:uncharacterized protein BDZ99DRAFT_512808 [Mytilinidion resinicola]|uniref:PSI domain-containing protein n=1 Tax=Mytilinidion resinicola TaxID=574789 RepID=A0A6A6Y1Q5_9PEZI|nr:uncharacterized protein BDZ99DRAFT_512808 [Mytilinidion resinicola]KAF2801737.1 hypothetical protein BDZ99DRAFT_512808 [Mytilinidion resinicola]
MPCPALIPRSELDFNLSSLALTLSGPKDDRERLEHCWGILDCGDCHRSQHHCGWCPISGTCLPLPLNPLARAFPLLSPISHHHICALGAERFELRTAGLGCQVSTITFLTSIVTILITLAVLLGSWLLIRLGRWGIGVWKRAKGGWVVYGDGSEGVWVRKGEGWGPWWRRVRGLQREEEVVVVHGEDGEQRRSWAARFGIGGGEGRRGEEEEERPLLGG